MNDVIIIGIGPAGVSAALYARRAGLSLTAIGGRESALGRAERIQNYYGLSDAMSGNALFETGLSQLVALDIPVVFDEVVDIRYGEDGAFTVSTAQSVHETKSVILATGAGRKSIRLEGIERFSGSGVSWCAVCDGFFFRGKDVAVLGSGEYARHEIESLLPLAKSVTLLTNGEQPAVEVPETVRVISTKLRALEGATSLEQVAFEDGSTLSVSGLFIAIGTAGASELARKLGAELDGANVKVDHNFNTSVPGLFAAGDCIGGMLQAAAAVYEGAAAAQSAIKFVRTKR